MNTGSKHTGFAHSLTYFATTAIGQGLGFLLLPFITRTLTPEQYGAYTLALTASSLVAVVASAWVRNVAIRLHFDAVSRGTTRGFLIGVLALQAALFVSLYGLLMIGIMLLGVELASWRVMVSAGMAVVVTDFASYAFTILRAEQRAWSFAVSEIGGGVLRFALTLGGLTVGIRSAELLFDATSVGFLIAGAYALMALRGHLTGPARIDVVAMLEVLRLGPASLPFGVANWVERLFDRLVVEYYLGTALVGVYSIGYSLGERTIGMLVQAVFMMAWPNILAAWEQGKTASARAAVTEAHKLYAWFSIGPTVFMTVFGGDLLRLVAGADYHDAAPIVAVIALSMWAEGFARLLNRHYELQKRFGPLSGFTVLGALVNLALNIVLVPVFGLMGAAWATLINRLFNVVVFYLTRDRSLLAVPVWTLVHALAWSLLAWAAVGFLPVPVIAKMAGFVAVYAPIAIIAMRKIDGARLVPPA